MILRCMKQVSRLRSMGTQPHKVRECLALCQKIGEHMPALCKTLQVKARDAATIAKDELQLRDHKEPDLRK